MWFGVSKEECTDHYSLARYSLQKQGDLGSNYGAPLPVSLPPPHRGSAWLVSVTPPRKRPFPSLRSAVDLQGMARKKVWGYSPAPAGAAAPPCAGQPFFVSVLGGQRLVGRPTDRRRPALWSEVMGLLLPVLGITCVRRVAGSGAQAAVACLAQDSLSGADTQLNVMHMGAAVRVPGRSIDVVTGEKSLEELKNGLQGGTLKLDME